MGEGGIWGERGRGVNDPISDVGGSFQLGGRGRRLTEAGVFLSPVFPVIPFCRLFFSGERLFRRSGYVGRFLDGCRCLEIGNATGLGR